MLAEAISGFDEMEAGIVDVVSKAKPGAELKMIIEHYLRLEHCSNKISSGHKLAPTKKDR